jgi:hypothetical protein
VCAARRKREQSGFRGDPPRTRNRQRT